MRFPFLIFIFLFLIPHASYAGIDFGISIGDEGIRGFYLAVGDYYRVPEKEVVVVRERGMPDDEIPVVFFIAERAHVSPSLILDLRLKGTSWLNISARFGLGPDVFYVPVKTARIGPPYGKAYGYYRNKPKSGWKKIVLRDDDIINLVNLRFVSEHYKLSPETVIKYREEGESFKSIHMKAKKSKEGKKQSPMKEKHGKGKGK